MWFAALILLQSTSSEREEEGVWEEQVVLFNAMTEEEAMQKATEYGKVQEHNYKNVYGEEVEWKFDSVDRLIPLDATEFSDGLEVFSRFVRHSEVMSLKTPFED